MSGQGTAVRGRARSPPALLLPLATPAGPARSVYPELERRAHYKGFL